MFDNVVTNLIANAIGGVLVFIANKLRLWLFVESKKRDPRRLSLVFLIPILTWLALNIVIFLPVSAVLPNSLKISVPIITSLVVFWCLWRDINQFLAVGILGADKNVRDGIDYEHSLRLCQNNLSFLGIGASKLTASDEFKKTLERCSDDQPTHFLLSEPTNENLKKAAKRANRPVEEYRNIVLKSLKIIAQLKNERNFKIDVRFYQNEPIFRMMFIDDSLCLLSYNIFGKGDGSDFPQLHIFNSSGKQKEKTFYYPLKIYFEQQWQKGVEWNFLKHIEEL